MHTDEDGGLERTQRPDIFGFRDYRQYLVAVIEARRIRSRGYKRLDFARSIGFASDSGLNMVLTGQRELRPPYLDKCIRNLRLNTRERLYFEAMVRASKMSPGSRRTLLKEVEMLSSTWTPPEPTSGIRLIDYFIVSQILCLPAPDDNPGWRTSQIRSLFRYEISEREIATILLWMEERCYVERVEAARGQERLLRTDKAAEAAETPSLSAGTVQLTPAPKSRSPQDEPQNEAQHGLWRVLKSVMTAQDEVPNPDLRRVHLDSFRLAEQALADDPLEAREFQTYFFTLDSRRLPELKHRIKRLVVDMLSEFETETDADSVMQMHFNLFEVIARKPKPAASALVSASKTRSEEDE